MPHEPLVPLTPHSGKSVSPKKSVRFRSGHSIIGNVHLHSSPITIPIKCPPSLSMVDIPNKPMFDMASDEEKDLGQTARPPDTLPSHMPLGLFPNEPNRSQLSLGPEHKFYIVQALPTPMPGTNLPLEDPFDDSAAALHSGNLSTRTSTGQTGTDYGYVSDKETNGTKTACISPLRLSSARSSPDPSPENSQHQKFKKVDAVKDSHHESLGNGPLAVERTMPRNEKPAVIFKKQESILRLPSETQYDADAEVSDDSVSQKAPIKSLVFKVQHRQKSHGIGVSNHSDFGTDLVRRGMGDPLRSTVNSTVQWTIAQRSSSDETEEIAMSVSAGNEAVLQSANIAEKGSNGMDKSYASDILQTTRQQKRSASKNICANLLPVEPTFEGMANAERAPGREPYQVRD